MLDPEYESEDAIERELQAQRGGIIRSHAVAGEVHNAKASRPEVVVPLNKRGLKLLGDVLKRAR